MLNVFQGRWTPQQVYEAMQDNQFPIARPEADGINSIRPSSIAYIGEGAEITYDNRVEFLNLYYLQINDLLKDYKRAWITISLRKLESPIVRGQTTAQLRFGAYSGYASPGSTSRQFFANPGSLTASRTSYSGSPEIGATSSTGDVTYDLFLFCTTEATVASRLLCSRMSEFGKLNTEMAFTFNGLATRFDGLILRSASSQSLFSGSISFRGLL